MAWTALVTQTNGTLITAATWNAQIEDNLTFLGATHNHGGGTGHGGTVAFLPAGAIMLRDAACPAGWTRVSALDGKFVRGASSYGGTGGAATHTHTVSALANHTHAVLSHTHTMGTTGASVGTAIGDHHGVVVQPIFPHTHEPTGASAANTDTSGAGSVGTSDAASSLPAYITVIFCKKDA